MGSRPTGLGNVKFIFPVFIKQPCYLLKVVINTSECWCQRGDFIKISAADAGGHVESRRSERESK